MKLTTHNTHTTQYTTHNHNQMHFIDRSSQYDARGALPARRLPRPLGEDVVSLPRGRREEAAELDLLEHAAEVFERHPPRPGFGEEKRMVGEREKQRNSWKGVRSPRRSKTTNAHPLPVRTNVDITGVCASRYPVS